MKNKKVISFLRLSLDMASLIVLLGWKAALLVVAAFLAFITLSLYINDL